MSKALEILGWLQGSLDYGTPEHSMVLELKAHLEEANKEDLREFTKHAMIAMAPFTPSSYRSPKIKALEAINLAKETLYLLGRNQEETADLSLGTLMLRRAALKFVNKVDSGQARSVESYGEFKEALEKLGVLQ